MNLYNGDTKLKQMRIRYDIMRRIHYYADKERRNINFEFLYKKCDIHNRFAKIRKQLGTS